MADVTTKVHKTVDSDTISNKSNSRTTTTTTEVHVPKKSMTVDKTVKTEQPAPGGNTTTTNTTTTTTSSSTKHGQTGSSTVGAPRGSPPTQMKAVPGSVATASPKKPDSKGNSPQSKSSADPHTATKSSLHPAQQQQLHSSSKSSPKKNPWNRNPSTANAPPASGGSGGRKNQVEGSSESSKPSGRSASEGTSSPHQKDSSRSIKIPRNEVQLFCVVSYSANVCDTYCCTNLWYLWRKRERDTQTDRQTDRQT